VPAYDVTDEAILNATPERVFRALVDEYAGVTHWWKQVESKPVGDIPFGQVGAVCTVTVRNHGTARFTWRTAEILENHRIRCEYLEGDLTGYGDLTLEPVGQATRIEYRWRVKTRGRANILGPLLNLKRRHSEVIQAGFRALAQHLARSGASPADGEPTK
jgi:uncharacterized protein YndB with AHSA1/START domain